QVGEAAAMAAVSGNSGGATMAVDGFAFDADDCVFTPGDPQDPIDPNNPVVPVSEGDLFDVRIIDNRIFGMGRNGIAAARLHFPAATPDLITVRHLAILDNIIEQCMQIEVGPVALANIRRVAF